MHRMQPTESGSYWYVRKDLQKEVSRLDKEEQRYTQVGNAAESDRIARIISRHSQALASSSTIYTDIDTGERYWLGREKLLGGGKEETLENAEWFYQLGARLYHEGKASEALVPWQKCVAIREHLTPDDKEIAQIYLDIGQVYQEQDHLDEALAQYQKSLSIFERLEPNGRDYVGCRHKIEKVYVAQRNFTKALESYQKTITIVENLAPNDFFYHLQCYVNIAEAYHGLGNCVEALTQYERCMWNLDRLSSDNLPKDTEITASLYIAEICKGIGAVYKTQGNFTKALEQYRKSTAILERLQPDSLNLAGCYTSMGELYQTQGRLAEASLQFKKSALIKENTPSKNPWEVLFAPGFAKSINYDLSTRITRSDYAKGRKPDSLEFAQACIKMGLLYQADGRFDHALEEFKKSLAMQVRLSRGGDASSSDDESDDLSLVTESDSSSHSLGIAACYNNIGSVYQSQGRLDEALARYQKSTMIQEHLAPNSLDVAETYCNMGTVHQAQGKSDEALVEYQKGVAILERLDSHGLDIATFYHNIGRVYQVQDKLAEALALFQKTYTIRERLLLPNHPDLLSLGNDLALTALHLSDYALALTHVTKVIASDPAYKYAYDTKGLVLRKQGKFEEALAAFDQALACDPGYADASIHRLQVIAELGRKTGNLGSVAQEIVKAQQLPKTDYDQRKKAELEKVARASKQNAKVELPKTEFQPGSLEYFEWLEEMLINLHTQMVAHGTRLDEHDVRLQIAEERLDLLNGSVLGLEDSLSIIKRANVELDRKMAGISSTDPLLQALIFEKGKLKTREGYIKGFNKIPDQRHYYYALLSELESAYLAAQVIKSGKLQEQKSDTYSKAASYVANIIELIPVVGKVASTLITGLAGVVDTRIFVKDKNAFLRIRNLASTVADFDEIAIRVAVEFTLRKSSVLAQLKGAEVPQDWKTKLKSLSGGIEGLMTEFLRDNETQAKVLGRLDAYKVISHLQEEAVSENYAIEEDEPEGSPTRRRKPSVIGYYIANAVSV